jgi:LDH2 family malate/lactate/ureidoglycolate dehydrogenase
VGNHLVSPDVLEDYCTALMMTQGVPEDEATIIARHLVEAELYGVSSHGVSRTSVYLKRLNTGVVNAKWSYQIEEEHPAVVHWNACNSMGMVTGVKAMEYCIEKARQSGCCFIAVNHSNHFGMAGYYAKMAAEQGMIGVCGTNAPPNIAPWGSYKPYTGTNPLAISAPRHGEPVLLDMAPSVVAMGKVILAAKLGKSIPEGWAITADGHPTTDPNEGMKGTVLPIGGPKGYGLSLFMDILCGLLSGAQFGPYLGNMWNDFVHPQNVGHIFFAVDIEKFTDLNTFKDRLEIMASDIKAMPKNPGVEEIFLPGELELSRKKEAEEKGILISDVVYQELVDLGNLYGVEKKI